MPYAMTHLIIADSLSKALTKHISNLPQFYLGNIAPDAVHSRVNYISDYKKDSHLCPSDEKWGMISNTDEWITNVIRFLDSHISSVNHDFAIGYCCHILADIYQYIALWLPFNEKYADVIDNGIIVNQMLKETNMIDIELALTYEKRDIFWSYIQQSVGVDLPGIICAADVEKQKDSILSLWYIDKERQDLASNEIVTVESIMSFIKNAVDSITLYLQEHLDM